MRNKVFTLIFILLSPHIYTQSQHSKTLSPYVKTLKEKGQKPIQFSLDKLDKYDLLVFDDALHTAVEPFEFYQKLVKNKEFQKKVKYIFLFVISLVTTLPAATKESSSIIFPGKIVA